MIAKKIAFEDFRDHHKNGREKIKQFKNIVKDLILADWKFRKEFNYIPRRRCN